MTKFSMRINRNSQKQYSPSVNTCLSQKLFYPTNAVITTHLDCGVYKTPRNCDDYARIIKGSLQNLPILLNSVKTA
ncbi:hypothetical protein NSTCB13_03015 [Nostoc sp. DSM 114160]